MNDSLLENLVSVLILSQEGELKKPDSVNQKNKSKVVKVYRIICIFKIHCVL